MMESQQKSGVRKEHTYSESDVETALCVYEYIHECYRNEDADELSKLIRLLFEAFGHGGMRSSCVQAARFVEKCYHFAEHNGLGHLTETFDWEFVPMICKRLNWETLCDNNQYGDGEWMPDAPAFMATIVAKEALSLS